MSVSKLISESRVSPRDNGYRPNTTILPTNNTDLHLQQTFKFRPSATQAEIKQIKKAKELLLLQDHYTIKFVITEPSAAKYDQSLPQHGHYTIKFIITKPSAAMSAPTPATTWPPQHQIHYQQTINSQIIHPNNEHRERP